MSLLTTHYYPDDHNFCRWGGNSLAVHLLPGEWVQHRLADQPGKGLLIAVCDDFIVILWSIPFRVTSVDRIAAKMAQDIATEEDNEILKILSELDGTCRF